MILPKVYIFLKIISIVFCISHVAFCAIFLVQGAYILGIYNAVSALFYAVMCYCLHITDSKNLVKLANILTHIILELSTHVCVTLFLVGEEFGFQHYIYGIFVFIMFENYLSSNLGKTIKLVAFSCLAMSIPYVYLYWGSSYYTCDESLATVFDLVNPIAVLILFIAYIFMFSSIVSEFEDNVIYQAYHDKLTGLNNRTLLQRVTFIQGKTHVAILDIDDFKKVNDTWGHDVGDLVLKHLSKVLTLEVRCHDNLHVMRWGGEEFVVIYNGDSNFLDIVNDIRNDILQSYVDNNSRRLIYRVTIGVADYFDGLDIEELIKVADDRLYTGKKTGKNKIVYKE